MGAVENRYYHRDIRPGHGIEFDFLTTLKKGLQVIFEAPREARPKAVFPKEPQYEPIGQSHDLLCPLFQKLKHHTLHALPPIRQVQAESLAQLCRAEP